MSCYAAMKNKPACPSKPKEEFIVGHLSNSYSSYLKTLLQLIKQQNNQRQTQTIPNPDETNVSV